MINLKVNLYNQPYPLFIGTNILANFAEAYKLFCQKSRAIILTDFKKDDGYFNIILENFGKQEIEIQPIFVAAYQKKNGLMAVQQIVNRLLALQFRPDETIISLGGSSIGNLSAFVAQLLYGGVSYFQIPTTLTSQVVQSTDPSCRIDYGSSLNLFAIQYERKLVWSDVALIKSLPEQNLISGLAHIIQLACLRDSGLFEFLEKNLKAIFDLNLAVIEETIIRSCQSSIDRPGKHHIETQKQQPRNFGEFFSAILMEATQNNLKYGEALLFGMLIEAIVAFRVGIFDACYFERFYEVLKQIPSSNVHRQIDWPKVIVCLNDSITNHKRPLLCLPQNFGSFVCFDNYKLSDFLAAFDLLCLD